MQVESRSPRFLRAPAPTRKAQSRKARLDPRRSANRHITPQKRVRPRRRLRPRKRTCQTPSQQFPHPRQNPPATPSPPRPGPPRIPWRWLLLLALSLEAFTLELQTGLQITGVPCSAKPFSCNTYKIDGGSSPTTITQFAALRSSTGERCLRCP